MMARYAEVFVDPSEYRAAMPHALGLQSWPVVASERYVVIVLAAVEERKLLPYGFVFSKLCGCTALRSCVKCTD